MCYITAWFSVPSIMSINFHLLSLIRSRFQYHQITSERFRKYENCKPNYENWKNDKFLKFILQLFHLFAMCICIRSKKCALPVRQDIKQNTHTHTHNEIILRSWEIFNILSEPLLDVAGRKAKNKRIEFVEKSKCVMSHSTDLVGTVPHYINSRLWGLNCNSLYVVHSQQTRMSFQSAAKLAVAANRRPIRPRFGVFLFPSLRCCCFCCCFLIFKWMAPYEFRMQTAREENNTVASGLGTNGRKYRDLLTSDHNKIKRVYFAATDVLPSK